MSHVFVPKHEILNEKEVEVITKQYNATPKFFPQILFTDPVIREIGAKPGDMIRITRNSPTAGEFFYYRYVVI
ncbi:DNA-directed RNA polymerase subunit H [Thermoproteota archaeon]